MGIVNNGIVARATGAQFMFSSPAATQGQRVVNIFPKEFSELMRDVNFPKVRNMMGDVKPVRGELDRKSVV